MAALLYKSQIKTEVYFRIKIVFAENTFACHNKPTATKCRSTEQIMHLSQPDRE
jgi:hypothetical protein